MSGERTAARATTPRESGPDAAELGDDDLFSRRWLRALLILLASLTLGAAVALAAVHVNDRFGLDHVSGSRMALARSFDQGTLYPELFDGRVYGGTRWMPLPTIIHGLAARVTGEYLISGKLVSYAVMAALLLIMLWVMRRLRTPLALALGLAAMVLVTRGGLTALADLRFDSLPLLLQLLAIETVARGSRPRAVVGAAALASLALISKATAVWAPVAIVAWLLVRRRRLAAWFSVAYVGFAGGLLLTFIAVTEGRIIENVFGLGAAGITGIRSLAVGPYRFVQLLASHATPAWALVPLAAFAAWMALRRRDASIYLVSLLCSVAMLVLTFADIGTGRNQLLDVIVLTAIVVGELGGRVASGTTFERSVRVGIGAILVLSVLWAVAGGVAVTLLPQVRATVSADNAFRVAPLEGIASVDTSILSEDPYASLSLGQTPVVLDPFMLLRIGQEYPSAVQRLIERIEAREFDLVVLVVPLQPPEQQWWAEYHFGLDVMRAIARSYEPRGRVQGYYLYSPRQGITAE